MTPRALAAAVLGGLLLTACGTAGSDRGPAGIRPVDGRSGLQLTGTVRGRQFAVNDGAPRLRVGDCDVNEGGDRDVCFFSRDLDGRFFSLIFENPATLVAGETVPVVDPGCAPSLCDDVTDGAIVDVGFAPDERRVRAEGGSVILRTVEAGARYSGTIRLELPDGNLSGSFEVVPRPEPED